jgi:hypothetical protein
MSGFVSISAGDCTRKFDIKTAGNAAFQPRLNQIHVGQHTMSPQFAFVLIALPVISGCAGLASTGTMSSSSLPGEAVRLRYGDTSQDRKQFPCRRSISFADSASKICRQVNRFGSSRPLRRLQKLNDGGSVGTQLSTSERLMQLTLTTSCSKTHRL